MVELGGITNLPWIGSAITGIAYGLITLVIMGVVGFAIYMFVKRNKHNIPTIIISERAGQSPKVIFDKGGYFKRNNQWSFKLLKMRKIIPPPNTHYLHTGAKGHNILFLRQKGIDAFVPIYFQFDERDMKFKVADMDTQLWADAMQEILVKTFWKQNWMQKYGSYIIFGITAMMCILLIYIVLQKFDGISSSLGSVANAAKHAAEIAGQCVQQVPAA